MSGDQWNVKVEGNAIFGPGGRIISSKKDTDSVKPRRCRVFFCYRRDLAPHAVGRVYDGIVDEIGREQVFRDIDSIGPGDVYHTKILTTLGACEVLLCLIAPGWIDTRGADGTRRLSDPRDFVRLEIETALALGLRVVPVLVEGAPMPSPTELPPPLAPLAHRHALNLRNDPDFTADVSNLISQLRSN